MIQELVCFIFGVFGYWNPVRIVSYSWFCWSNYLFIHKIVFLTCGLIIMLLVGLIRYLWEYLIIFKKKKWVGLFHLTTDGLICIDFKSTCYIKGNHIRVVSRRNNRIQNFLNCQYSNKYQILQQLPNSYVHEVDRFIRHRFAFEREIGVGITR